MFIGSWQRPKSIQGLGRGSKYELVLSYHFSWGRQAVPILMEENCPRCPPQHMLCNSFCSALRHSVCTTDHLRCYPCLRGKPCPMRGIARTPSTILVPFKSPR